MRLGLVTDSLAQFPFLKLLAHIAGLGITAVEFPCGNWSAAPHVQLDRLLTDGAARDRFLASVHEHGLEISALNCSGNPLHPGASGEEHRRVTAKTIQLAGMLGVRRVVLMSGCPGGPGDANANWITTSWPPETALVLDWQWQEQIIPYWRGLAAEAGAAGVEQLCIELHGHQAVYNVATLHRLRDAVGPVIGANFDPSHLMWMGADPLAAIRTLEGAIYHVHAKDTRIDPLRAGINGVIDTTPNDRLAERSWSYVTLGVGHDALWWKQFCTALKLVGYDDVLSIEHEDLLLTPEEGVRRSVAFLQQAI